MSLTELMAMAPLMNPREDIQPDALPTDELMAALIEAQQALYRAEDAHMLGSPEGLLLGMQTALKRLQEVLG